MSVSNFALLSIICIEKIFIILVPFFVVYIATKTFEKESKKRLSHKLFWVGFSFAIINLVGTTSGRMVRAIREEKGAAPLITPEMTYHLAPVYIVEVLISLFLLICGFLLFYFLLKSRESQTGKSAYERVMGILPLVLLVSLFFIGFYWGLIPTNGIRPTVARVSMGLGYFFISLCYIELSDFSKRFKVSSWPLLICAAIILLGLPVCIIHDGTMLVMGRVLESPYHTLIERFIGFTLGFVATILAVIPTIELCKRVRKTLEK